MIKKDFVEFYFTYDSNRDKNLEMSILSLIFIAMINYISRSVFKINM